MIPGDESGSHYSKTVRQEIAQYVCLVGEEEDGVSVNKDTILANI